ncbi:MAG: hypothetical protein WCA22_00710 [Candidatus Binatus sp.]
MSTRTRGSQHELAEMARRLKRERKQARKLQREKNKAAQAGSSPAGSVSIRC